MLFSKKSPVGLDIGSSAIKLVQLDSSRSRYRVKTVGEISLPKEAIINKVIVQPDVVAERIATLVEDLGVKTKNVVISVSGHSVIIKKITIPSMSLEELEESIPWELEQYLPQSIEDVYYDYEVFPDVTPEGNMDVIIVAAKRDITDSYINVVRDAGLHPIVVDVDVFAIENVYEMNYEITSDLIALVNIGASVTNVNIVKDGVSIFTRDISVGGIQFTDRLMKELDMSYEEAEQIKRDELGKEDLSLQIEKVKNEFIDILTEEIKRTLDFFVANFWKDRISKIILGGGTSKIPGLVELLSDVANAEVELLDPFKRIEISTFDFDAGYIKENSPKMGVAVGLALRSAEDKKR